MYTDTNFKTKKALKTAIADGKQVSVFAPGLGSVPYDGIVPLEGPHFPAPHSWYAMGTIKDGVLVKVV